MWFSLPGTGLPAGSLQEPVPDYLLEYPANGLESKPGAQSPLVQQEDPDGGPKGAQWEGEGFN